MLDAEMAAGLIGASAKTLVVLTNRHAGTDKALPAEKQRVEITDKNGNTKAIKRWMFDEEALIDWAAKHYDTHEDHRAKRVNDEDEERTTVFEEGLDLTKRQKRNLAALTAQWNCSSEDAMKRILNVQGHSLGRAVNGIDTGELIFLGVNDRGKEWLQKRAKFWGNGTDEVVIQLLRNTELGPYLRQDSSNK
jgi:hypothetical protein